MQNEEMIQRDFLAYRVGGLLYVPALHQTIAEKLIRQSIPYLTSVAFCLEDTIQDNALEEAEQTVCRTFLKLYQANCKKLPLLFIRVRSAAQMQSVYDSLGDSAALLTGFILPKFDMSNADAYLQTLQKINQNAEHTLYAMPILESRVIADIKTRIAELTALREKLMHIQELILNIRVGGSDFCNIYSLRRSENQNIYQIGVVRDILMDILNQFSDEFVISAPVWEYFGTENVSWVQGMQEEMLLDRLNGFIGKTAIHPSQLPLIWENMKVSQEEYRDACRILNWNDAQKAVQKSPDGTHMNEVKCHRRWAHRIFLLGNLYGIRQKEVHSFAL